MDNSDTTADIAQLRNRAEDAEAAYLGLCARVEEDKAEIARLKAALAEAEERVIHITTDGIILRRKLSDLLNPRAITERDALRREALAINIKAALGCSVKSVFVKE